MSGRTKDQNPGNYSISSLIGPIDIPDSQASIIRARQLLAVCRIIPVLALANLVNVAVVAMSFWNTPANRLIGFWCSTLVLATAIIVIGDIRSRLRPSNEQAIDVHADDTQVRIERFARFGSFLGLLWGVLPLLIMPFTDSTSQLAVSVIIAGVMFAGVLLVGRIPEAAVSFLVPISVGYIVGLQLGQDPRNGYLSVLAIVYACVLWVSSRWSYRQFVEQHLSSLAVQSQAQLIGLLLRDFEETTSDWLWQTNEAGLLIDIPVPVTGSAVKQDKMVPGTAIVDLFKPGDALSALETQCIVSRVSAIYVYNSRATRTGGGP